MSPGRFLAVLSCALILSPAASAAKHEIRWVLAHDQSVTAEQSARDFAARIEREADGDIRVSVIKSADYNKSFGKVLSHRQLMKALSDGKIEMTQMYTAALAAYNTKLFTLWNPYLFRDYVHAEAAFDGPLGAKFLATVPPSSGMLRSASRTAAASASSPRRGRPFGVRPT